MTLWTAMACAAAVTAAFVSGKATRDALFLTSLDFTALPMMLIATSAVSILLVVVYSRVARRVSPATLIPALFAASGVLFIAEWFFRGYAPSAAAVCLYLHISGAGPLLASGFWLIATERFDPRSAKQHFGQIAGAGTLGGFLSALVAERVGSAFGAPSMLFVLAALQFVCAVLVRRLGQTRTAAANPHADGTIFQAEGVSPEPVDFRESGSALLSIAETPYLRHLAALVVFGTTSAALIDYLFKAHAVEHFGRGDQLLRFFALYYAATSLLTFVLQTSFSRTILERFGIGWTTSTPSYALLIGSVGSLIAPGFSSLMLARGGESVLRSSWFRAGYELFYTPIPAAEKRAAKSLIDVGFDRLGDAIGGGLVRIASWLAPAAESPLLLSLTIVCSGIAVVAARRLNSGYLGTLANNLVHHGLPEQPASKTTRVMGQVMRSIHQQEAAAGSDGTGLELASGDADVRDIMTLRSRDRQRVIVVLSRPEGLSAALVAHVIPLLAWEAVANHALFALRKIAEEHVGQLADALIDPNQPFAVRRRLARVFAVGVSARAADAAMLGLDDARFDVRFQSARSLQAIVEKNPRIAIDRDRIFQVVLREAAVSRPVWESRRLLEDVGPESPLDAFVRDRAGESLAHVFTLLALVLPREPLLIAFRSLHSEDAHLRGTALEYLDGMLPPPIRQRLWPFLESGPSGPPERTRHEVVADLLRAHQSVALNLDAWRRATLGTSNSRG